MLPESERKYEDIARKLGRMESDLERSNERAEAGECKIIELEDELKVVGNNLQSLEVSEEKANQREEAYQKQIHDLMQRLKLTETKAENSEMNIQRLNIRVDQVEHVFHFHATIYAIWCFLCRSKMTYWPKSLRSSRSPTIWTVSSGT